jgi:hypothetical protein
MQKGRQRKEIHAYMREAWIGNIHSLSANKELNAMPNVMKLPTDFFEHLY